jgi:hypothetical protein
MKRIVVIESDYARDTQIFFGNPNEEDYIESDSWYDVKYPNLYIGIFEGIDENEIRKKAAKDFEVHEDVFTLYEVEN